jgi:hypothetical protein
VSCTIPGAIFTELLLDAGRAFLLGIFIDGKKGRRSGRKLIGSNLTLGECPFRNRHCRPRIRPAGVKRESRDDLGNLAWFNAVVECDVDVVGHLDRLVARDQSFRLFCTFEGDLRGGQCRCLKPDRERSVSLQSRSRSASTPAARNVRMRLVRTTATKPVMPAARFKIIRMIRRVRFVNLGVVLIAPSTVASPSRVACQAAAPDQTAVLQQAPRLTLQARLQSHIRSLQSIGRSRGNSCFLILFVIQNGSGRFQPDWRRGKAGFPLVLGTAAALLPPDPTEASYFQRISSYHGFNNVLTGNATVIGTIAAPVSSSGCLGETRKCNQLRCSAVKLSPMPTS